MKTKYRQSISAIKPGDLLITEEPYAYVLSSKEKGIRCDYCLTKGKVLKCSGCQFVHYCGRVCQKDAWNDHKWECHNLKRVAPKVIPDAARMLAKIINRQKRGDGNTYRSFYSATSFRMWKDLMSHYSDLKSDKKRMDHFTTLCMVLYEFLKDTSIPNTVELMGLYGRMVINSFTILDMDMNSIGTALYLGCSIVDHSCNPNAVATFDGKTISIRATKHMPYLDWNQIRISYIDLMKTPYERQMELLHNYYFLCQCDRCLDENQIRCAHAAKCLNPDCDYPVQVHWKDGCQLVKRTENNDEGDEDEVHQNGHADVTRCNECGTKYSQEKADEFKKTMEMTEMHLHEMKAASVAYVDVCKFCLQKQEGLLHPYNVMYAQTLDHAFDALIQVQLWEQACTYGEALLPCFRYYYGDYHPLVALLHMKYGKLLIYTMRSSKAVSHLKSAETILRVTHGDKHPLYKELMPLLHQAML